MKEKCKKQQKTNKDKRERGSGDYSEKVQAK